MILAAVESDERRLVEGLESLLLPVEHRGLAARRMAIVDVHTAGEGVLRQLELALDFLPGVTGGADLDLSEHLHLAHTVGVLIGQQPNPLTVLLQHAMRHAAMVAIFIDEALAALVDDDALHQRARRIPGNGGKSLRHVDRSAADAHAEANARSVIDRADREAGAQHERSMLLHHVAVHDEAAGAQHDAAAGPHELRLPVDACYEAVHAPVLVRDERKRARVVHDLDSETVDLIGELIHDVAAATHP